ncbi:SIS domain-containing protein [Chitinophaga sp.]|uniref:SIS domain-containing protein n=1 Tax=Chitinophaga sp. TaxID=1869181 RepID=UPI00260DF5C6|nr:SIS domain-containing protein [uncultured Chitinophaga sp.]
MASSHADQIEEQLIFGKPGKEWQELRGGHTAREIHQQPQLWEKTWQLVQSRRDSIQQFLNGVFRHPDLEIILTGAGSSAFIGVILEGAFQQHTGRKTSAYATTDLLTHPQLHFRKNKPVLLVSFARSGNSPESEAAVQLANRYCDTVYHLIITCSASGQLVQSQHIHPGYVLLLPAESNDQGLAMTGSFTSMLLAGLLIARIRELDRLQPQLERLVRYGRNILDHFSHPLQHIAGMQFDRTVFLGSGPLYGAAMESHLKVQELTDGKTICKYDSFLSFRHGPKVVITPSTLLVYLCSNDPYVAQYELDLVKSIHAGESGLHRIAVSESDNACMQFSDTRLVLNNDAEHLEEAFLAICHVLPAQLIGFFKSLSLGLHPDSPSLNGTITRVVQGVTIYNWPGPQTD